MNYSEALDYIHGTKRFGIKLGLENITKLMELLGNPHKQLKFIHVAGTNGKGSTAAFLTSIFMEAGYRTGMYISPYIQTFNERIKVNGENILDNDLARLTGLVRDAAEKMTEVARASAEKMTGASYNHPTEFELVTAIALLHYFEQRCDVVVLEVGMGGRYDSTNVIDAPLVAVITTIDYDHMEYLGDTLEKIAYEKGGIIKSGCDVVLYPQIDSVKKVFEDIAHGVGAQIHFVDFSFLGKGDAGLLGQSFDYKNYKDMKISLLGEFQLCNAALALEAAEVISRNPGSGLRISERQLRSGLLNAKWPGRMELALEKPTFIIDAAHNLQCSQALRASLEKSFPDRKRIFIFGLLRDKDHDAIIKAIIPGAHAVFTVTPENERALTAEELAGFVRGVCDNVYPCDSIEEAVDRSIESARAIDGNVETAQVIEGSIETARAIDGSSETARTIEGSIETARAIEGSAETARAIDSATNGRQAVICSFGSLYYIGRVREILGLTPP
ncbi:MAG: bifunctional folylpolyglutamate synthase/dihydrofolate synthase [Oscillospiraceae bacterium]|nr:bifunctional folylpolyglutamate synthase/dihydrofolate synthase [Oscillospiraceae bacterium]